jgi:hypothetical protein
MNVKYAHRKFTPDIKIDGDGVDIFPPKRRLSFNGLQGIISQKTELFITTAVRTSDPTFLPSTC